MFNIIMQENHLCIDPFTINNKSNCFNVRIYSFKKCFTDIYTIKDAQITDHKSILCASLLL